MDPYYKRLEALAVEMETEAGISSMQFDGAAASVLLRRCAQRLRAVASSLKPYEDNGPFVQDAELFRTLAAMRNAYGPLHDCLSDCIERGALREVDLPDDYQALVHHLEACAEADHDAEALIAKLRNG